MSLANILVLGGSGFVGRYLVPRLDAAGLQRHRADAQSGAGAPLILLPQTDVAKVDLHDDADWTG